jgi:hypothetical protein
MTYSHCVLTHIAASSPLVSIRPFLGLNLYQQSEAAQEIAIALRSHLGCTDPLPAFEEDAREALAAACRDYRAAVDGFPAAMTRVMCAQWAYWSWIIYRSPVASHGLADAADHYLTLSESETKVVVDLQSAAWARHRQDIARRYA